MNLTQNYQTLTICKTKGIPIGYLIWTIVLIFYTLYKIKLITMITMFLT